MKKRIITILLALTILLCLSVSVFAESQLWNITDDAGLLSDEEYTQLESYAESVSETYGVGVYVITIDNYEDYYDSPYETAWQFYHEYTLGEGEDRDGIILLLSMDNRQFANFVYGPKADYAFDEHGVLELNDWYLDDFRNDDWAGGLNHFVAGCEDFLAKAAAGEPVRRSTTGPILLITLGSMVFALIVCLILKGKMKSVRAGTHANAYVVGALNVTASRDQFTHTTETRTKIEKESSSSSGSSESGGGGHGSSGSFSPQIKRRSLLIWRGCAPHRASLQAKPARTHSLRDRYFSGRRSRRITWISILFHACGRETLRGFSQTFENPACSFLGRVGFFGFLYERFLAFCRTRCYDTHALHHLRPRREYHAIIHAKKRFLCK